MLAILVIILLLIVLVAWFALDFSLGKKAHLQKQEEQTFSKKHAHIQLFTNGTDLFKDLFAAIDQATHSIHIEFYIIKRDNISQQFLQLLEKKASEGVEVRLLTDRIGSLKIRKKAISSLKAHGVQFSYSQIPRLPFLFYTLHARNHRKISVIDGKVGYIGGFNIGQEYLGLDPTLGIWKDYHLKLKGLVVNDLQRQFLLDWKATTKNNLLHESRYFSAQPAGTEMVQLKSTEGYTLERDFLMLIEKAKHELCIGTPYFIPSEKLFNALLEAIKRGVKVNVLIPMRADHPFVRDAAFAYIPTLLEAGGSVYEYYYGFYHAKVIIVDDDICDIGTGNFDKRSLFLNQEVNCYIFDQSFIKQAKETFYKSLMESKQLQLKDLKKRKLLDHVKQAFATLISPLL
ncbi:cardiolipin synthase [Metabacillus iocasae]|uniref:Cardiolipin synthase n=1 Tax=Priestia iocasae TaxID=2291674 RepID=A0ABS2QX94_9BACI|nr:cardiolipin synthase [Metabacillus iocasae]MBM7704091.1 cardiolipin synthase [Metabacillus iocasae]